MRIDSIAADPRRPGVLRLRFDDGSALRVPQELIADLGLHGGLTLTGDAFARLLAAIAEHEARAVAARLLAGRPHARRELLQKLCRKGIDPVAAESAVARMAELGYLDDGQYARMVAESCVRRGYGRRRVEDELRKRCVDRADWPEEPEDRDDARAAIDAFLRNKLRGRVPDEGEIRRLSAALARRGFDWSDIRAGLRRSEREPSDDSKR